jgi:hypothetical protein
MLLGEAELRTNARASVERGKPSGVRIPDRRIAYRRSPIGDRRAEIAEQRSPPEDRRSENGEQAGAAEQCRRSGKPGWKETAPMKVNGD